jgi:hypothetical protein
MPQKEYPQGLKKNPLKVINPDGSVKKYNSYLEAMDADQNMTRALMNEHYSPLGGQDEFAKANNQATNEGYTPWDAGNMEPLANKVFNTRRSIEGRNADWMAKTAVKKPAYSGQSTVSKLMGVKNPKR